MLTKIFIIYAIFCVICFLYFLATLITIAWDIKRNNPNCNPKSNAVAAIASLFKMLIISVLPIINMGVLFVCLFHYDAMKERFEQMV